MKKSPIHSATPAASTLQSILDRYPDVTPSSVMQSAVSAFNQEETKRLEAEALDNLRRVHSHLGERVGQLKAARQVAARCERKVQQADSAAKAFIATGDYNAFLTTIGTYIE